MFALGSTCRIACTAGMGSLLWSEPRSGARKGRYIGRAKARPGTG